ncbi:MAG: PDZ domain-containing protein [Rhodanobacteraceae bacterium]|jgi:C-terminal processing protease CtpA/Prc|nr:PDZ domain-containing protein [Rhodanobacteraceae bacterium]
MNRRVALVMLLVGAVGFSSLSSAAEKGWFGFGVSIETKGFSFNPTIQSVTVAKVAPASPAAAADVASGDAIVAVQGIVVDGAKADELKKAMAVPVGETLRLRLKRGSAEPREVALVAAAKP